MNYAQKSFLAEKKKTSVDMDDENADVYSSDGFGVVKHNNTCEYSDHFPSGFCKKTSRNNTHI